MHRFRSIVVTLLCILLAIACYLAGAETGVVVVLAAGILFETAFWLRLFKRRRTPPP